MSSSSTRKNKRAQKHPLEKWAELFNTFIAKSLIVTSLIPAMQSDTERRFAYSSLANAAAIVFAYELAQGRGHIVRITDEIYDDIIDSKFEKASNQEPDMLPWPIFAIETKEKYPWQAVIVTRWSEVAKRIVDALLWMGVGNEITEYVGLLRESSENILLPEELAEGITTEDLLIIANVPHPKRVEEETEYFIQLNLDTCQNQQYNMSSEQQKTVEYMLRKSGSVPLELGWNLSIKPNYDDMLKLIMFVIAENAVMRTISEPNPNLGNVKSKHKLRKRSKATVHEVGFEWTEAYTEYQTAKASNKLGGHVRPHTRRGHFHRFRTGPRNAETPTYVTHWIPPTLVKGGQRTNVGHVISKPRGKKE